jgi:hypothetical protein
MAISINTRPRLLAYSSGGSPSVSVYSNWTATRPSGVIFGFDIQNSTDAQSTININIYEVGTDTLLDSISTRPFSTGTFYVDLASYLRSYLYTEYNPDFGTEINAKDLGASIRFYITWQVIQPDGTDLGFVSEVDRPLQAINASVEFGNENDSNVIEYVGLPDEQVEASRAKFLSVFDEPVMWEGYDFTISFIYDNYLIGNELIRTQEELNINSVSLTTTEDILDYSQVRNVNILRVSEPTDLNASFINLSLNLGDPQLNYYVDAGYVDDGYHVIE